MIKNGIIGAVCFVLGVAAFAIAQTTADMEKEARAALEKADAELNKVYKELRETLSEEEKARLKEVQKLWITFRDKEAEFAASLYEGGSMAGLVKINTTTTATETRVEGLKNLFREGYPEGQ
jgi:uncharacterized protein YecT (DUF1311 family)